MAQHARWLTERWDELQSPSTPASFQVRLHHLPSLVQELQQVARLESSGSNGKWSRHLKFLLEEIKEQNSPGKVPWLGTRSTELLSQLDPADSKDYRKLEAQASVLMDEIGDYRTGLAAELSRMVEQHDEQRDTSSPKWTNWDRLLGAVATELCISGVPLSGCRGDLEGAKVGQSFDGIPSWLQRQLAFARKCREGSLYFVLGSNHWTDTEGLSQELQRVFAGLPLTAESGGRPRFAKARKAETTQVMALLAGAVAPAVGKLRFNGDSTVVCRVNSRTWKWELEERQNAWQQMRTLLDLHGFHMQQKPARLHPYMVTQSQGQWYMETVSSEVHSALQPRTEAIKLNRDLSAATGGLQRFPATLRDVLHHYSLASISPSPEARLVLLWSALETLVGSADDKLSHVQRIVSPIVAHHSFVRRLRYLSIRFRELDAPALEFPFSCGRFDVDPRLLLNYLSVKKDSRDKEFDSRFMASIGTASPLLRTRLTWEHKELSDRRKMLKRLTASGKNVCWNLARIYRMRNLLVHGSGPETMVNTRDADRLSAHLQDYVATVVNRVLTDLRNRRVTEVRHSLERRVMLRDQLEYKLKTAAPVATIDVLPDAPDHRCELDLA